MPRTVLIIGGPTASGKSGLAAAVAAALSGAVVNADSMQLYRGLPTLTAQPSAAELALAPHRLYAALAPDDACSAARWRDMALAEIEKTGGTNVVCGGTGFYLKTLIEGISPIPEIPRTAREEATALQRKLGNPGFHAALAERDPVMAARLHPFNTQRLIRAWEVLAATGKSLAVWQEIPPDRPPAHLRFVTVLLLPPREALYAACDARLARMAEGGALEETAALMRAIAAGETGAEAPLTRALGYAELAAHLRGETGLAEAVARAQQATRRYAKRQVTWFRHQLRADLVLETPDAGAVLELLRRPV